MRILLLPGNNSLSHVAQALSVDAALRARGHESLLAVSRGSARLPESLGIAHVVAPDIQETDLAAFPTPAWFHRRAIAAVVKAERALIREFRPERVLGIFRSTAKASASLEGVPFDSLACGCMLEECPDVLGFLRGDEGRNAQAAELDDFWGFAGRRFSAALAPAGFRPIQDIRSMYRGERTFLWDTPDFQPLPSFPGARYIGPVLWDRWPGDGAGGKEHRDAVRPLAVVTFGTCAGSPAAAGRFARVLSGMGWRVVIAAGGQEALTRMPAPEGVEILGFPSVGRLLSEAALLVCHGGQMTVFEALGRGVPVLVMPFQPEQAHNGLCLQRTGCGRSLLPPVLFRGDPSVYLAALDALSDDDVRRVVEALMADPGVRAALARMRESLSRYRGAETVAELLDSPCSPA